jgi:uncharacterized protein involved in outer membrane biogenesis
VRKLLIGIVVLLVVLVAAAFVVPRFIPADSLKADIAEQVRAATGRDLIIDGDLSFTLLPTPGVSVSGVRMSNIEGAQAADMVRLKSAQVAVALRPLFGGTIEIERVVLVEPVFELEQQADGSNNWTFAPSQPAAEAPSADSGNPSDTGSGGFGRSVQLNDLVVRDGTIIYRAPDITERVEGINASFSAASLLGPFRAEGDVVLRGMPARLRVAIGELQTDRAIPVNASAGIKDGEATFSGLLSGFPNELRIAGEIEGKAANVADVITAVSGQASLVALAASPLAIKGDLSANSTIVALNNLSIGWGDINANGAANVALGEVPAVDLILNVGQLDLDRLLSEFKSASGNNAGSGKAREGDRATGQPGGDPASKAGAPSNAGFALPKSLNATIETKIEALRYRGGVIRQAALNAQLTAGELTISQLTARLPGSADVSLFGFVAERDGVPAFGGQGEANADDLRGLLAWLGIDVSAVPLDRLRKLALTAKVDGMPDQLNVTDIDLGIDGTRIRGGIAVALRKRLGLGIGLSLDKLNIDAYLPVAGKSPQPSNTAVTQPSASKPAGDTGAPPSGVAGLAFLDRFDTVLQLKAGTLTYRGKSIQGVNIDGTLAAGAFDLRDASVKSLAGARAKASGRIEGLASPAPSVDLKLDIDAKESDRLLEMLGTAPSFAVGPGRLQGSVRGNLDILNVDLTLSALEAKLATKGKVSELTGDLEFDLSLDLSHGDATALLSRVSGNGKAVKAGRAPEALRVAAAVTGSLPKSAFSAGISLGAGSFSVQGKISDAGTDRMSGGVAVSGNHPNLAKAIRVFSPDYRPALAEPGPLKFSTDMAFDPTTLRIDNLRGNAGPVSFESSANVALDGVRPRVTGDLKTSEIIVDWFLPVQKKAAPTAGPSGASSRSGGKPAAARAAGERWSNERLDISALRNVDGEITLTAPAITYTDLKVDNPKIALTLADGVLDLGELSGRAYGGAFNMTGQLADKKVPSLSYVLSIDGADAAQFTGAAGQEGRGVMSVLDLLFPVSSVKLASGTLDAKIDVASQGRSERELISALTGNGSVTFTDAVAEGVDVCRISNQLGNLNGLEGFLGLVISAQGGATRIANYAGQFDIAKGVATLPRQRITADCATIDFAGNVDLPRWLVDIQAKTLFPEHPKFPGIIVEEKGRLDAPNVRLVNSNEVQQYVLGKSAGSILRKLVPGIDQQPAPQDSSGSQPAPAPQPAEQFRSLLNDLIKKR